MAGRHGQAVNWALLMLFGSATLFAFLVVPLWLLPKSPWWGVTLIPIALLSNSFWALNHEAIHGSFNPDPRVNQHSGRAMAVLLGTSFRLVRFAHLMHHRYNRYRLDRPDVYEPEKGPYAVAKLRYVSELLLLLYLSEVVVPLLCLLPKSVMRRIFDYVYRHPDPAVQEVRTIGARVFFRHSSLKELRIDAILVVLMVAGALVLYGPWWPMFAAFLIGRGVLISALDNVYHFGTPLDRIDFAMNLHLPTPLRLAILNMNMHRVHHHDPQLPWWRLPAQFRAMGDSFDAGFIDTALAQFSGPVRMTAASAVRAEQA
ncbi:MAG: fatty acid desaturase [Dongiaceae bacterium]